MMKFGIRDVFAFCSPALYTDSQGVFKEFCLEQIAPLERRRLGNATKCALSLMNHLNLQTSPQIIFSSYSGEIHCALQLLRTLNLESSVSPTQFSLSVLNATPATLAILTKNKSKIAAISAMPSLEYGFVNADAQEETLLITYEEYLQDEGFEFLMILAHLDPKNFKKELELSFTTQEEKAPNDMVHPLKFVQNFYKDSKDSPQIWENTSANLRWRWNLK